MSSEQPFLIPAVWKRQVFVRVAARARAAAAAERSRAPPPLTPLSSRPSKKGLLNIEINSVIFQHPALVRLIDNAALIYYLLLPSRLLQEVSAYIIPDIA